MPEIQKWKGNELLCLNPKEEKYQFKFGASKARVILDNKMNISDFYDICKKGWDKNDLSIDENLRNKIQEKYSANSKKYLVLDITPEINLSGKPFLINYFQAEMILDKFNSIVSFVERDDTNKGYYAGKKWTEEANKKAGMGRK